MCIRDSSKTSFSKTSDADLRTDHNMYTIEMRIRGNKVRVYSSNSYTLHFTATVSGFSGGYADFRCGRKLYSVTVTPKDINVWVSRMFLGDTDGFSILYYQDVDSLVYWTNEAAYRWELRGIAIWSLGQEDMRLWEALPKQI